MTRATFEPALGRVLVHEGGFANHPRDPGGATNKGVTQRVYDAYRQRVGRPPRSVREIEGSELLEIYRGQYWDHVKADDLPPGIDYVVFDGAVNSGPVQSIRWLQRALGVRVDGQIGSVTITAAWNHLDHDALIAEICERRLGTLQGLATWPTFGRGWGRRIADVERAGQAWATGSVPARAVHAEGGEARALVTDAAHPPVTASTGGITAAGGGGVAALLQATSEQIQPLAGTSSTLATVFTALSLAGAAVAIGGIVYALWAERRRKAAEAAADGELRADLTSYREALA